MIAQAYSVYKFKYNLYSHHHPLLTPLFESIAGKATKKLLRFPNYPIHIFIKFWLSRMRHAVWITRSPLCFQGGSRSFEEKTSPFRAVKFRLLFFSVWLYVLPCSHRRHFPSSSGHAMHADN
jgi:hypothetical protein